MQFVKYIGTSSLRRITAEDWKSVGVDLETMEWGPHNGFMLSLDNFSDEVVERYIRPDKGFIIVGQDEQPRPVADNLTGAEANAPKPARITDEERAQQAAGGDGTTGGGTGGTTTGSKASTATSGAPKPGAVGGSTANTGTSGV